MLRLFVTGILRGFSHIFSTLNVRVCPVTKLRVVGIKILIPEPDVGIDYNWVAGFRFLEVGFWNSKFGFQFGPHHGNYLTWTTVLTELFMMQVSDDLRVW